MTFPDGGKFLGESKEDNPWNGNLYDKHGNVTSKFM